MSSAFRLTLAALALAALAPAPGAQEFDRDARAATLGEIDVSTLPLSEPTAIAWQDLPGSPVSATPEAAPLARFRSAAAVDRYVDGSVAASGAGTSWDTAYKTLTEALAVAGAGDIIRVAEGTYTPTTTGDRTATFRVPAGVQVLGGYASGGTSRDLLPSNGVTDTILSGEIQGNGDPVDNSYHVIFMDGSEGNPAITSDPADPGYTLLEGVTIFAGAALGGFDDTFKGGGLYCDALGGGACSPAITNVLFQANIARSGGAVYHRGAGGSAVSSPVFTYVVFFDNRGQSGGAVNSTGAFGARAEPVFTNVTFALNKRLNTSGGFGGALATRSVGGESSPTFANVLFYGNQSGSGGAVFVDFERGTSSPTFTNVTFADNTLRDGSTAGGAVLISPDGGEAGASAPEFQNVIVWNAVPGSGPLVSVDSRATPSFDHAIVQGGCPPGATCADVTSADPLFDSAYRPQDGSPAIDAGDAALLPADTSDLDGDGDTSERLPLDYAGSVRVSRGQVDLGIYERFFPPPVTRYVDASRPASGDGQSWGTAFRTLGEALALANPGDDIRIAQGTYTPGVDRDASFVVPAGVQLVGGFAPGGVAYDPTPNDGLFDTVLSGEIQGDGNPANNVYSVVRVVGDPAATATPGEPDYTLLSGLTITGGNADLSGPDPARYGGGGLYCDGTFDKTCSPALVDVAFVGNRAIEGGAVFTNGTFSGDSDPAFTNVTFSGNAATQEGGAVYTAGGSGQSSPVFTNAVFTGNTARLGGAVFADGAFGQSNPVFTNATFAGNAASVRGGAVGLSDQSGTASPLFRNAILWGNTAPEGVALARGGRFEHAVVEGGCPTNAACSDVTDADPLLAADLTLLSGSPAMNLGDTAFLPPDSYDLDSDGNTLETLPVDLARGLRVLDGTVDAGAFERTDSACGGVCFVDAGAAAGGDGRSWATAFPTLAEALAVAEAGEVVRVAEGTYTPSATGDRNASFVVPSGVQVVGGYARGGATRDQTPGDGVTDTVLSGEIQGDGTAANNSYSVVRMTGSPAITATPGEPGYTLLDGLTITGGAANATGSGGSPAGNGGGLFCDGRFGKTCSPALTRVEFRQNAAADLGGAFYAAGRNGTSSPVFTNATFVQNSAGFGGGAVFAFGFQGTSSPVFANATFAQNSATNGGAVYAGGDGGNGSQSSPVFTSVTLAQNSATNGGAVYANGIDGTSSPVFSNAVLWGNTAGSGGQVYLLGSGATPTFRHAVLQGGCSAVVAASGAPAPTCSDVLDADPLLAADLTLRAGSPAIDFGDPALLPADSADLDGDGDRAEALPLDLAGRARQQGAGLDLGAFERFADGGLLTGAEGWRMLSAPSTTETVGGLLSTVWTQGFPGADTEAGAANAYRYDESAVGDLSAGYVAPSAGDALPAGAGLFVYVFADDDPTTPEVDGGFPKRLTASGSAAPAPFDFALSYTDTGSPSDDGWNLVGNPFDAGLGLDALTRTDVSGAAYVWDPAQGRYLTRSAAVGDLGSVLGSFQGFWVQATGPSPTLVAPPAARVGDTGLVGRRAAPVALRLTVTAEASAADDAAWVVFAEGAADGLDALDAYELAGLVERPVSLYTLADGTSLDVAAVPEGGAEVPLAVTVAETGGYVLRWPVVDVPEGWRLMLADAETGAEIDLRAQSEYAFTAEGSEAQARTSQAGPLAGPPAPRPLVAPASGASASARRSGARFTLSAGLAATSAGGDAPAETTLGAARPNPSSTGARLALALAEAGPVRAEVYDALGRRVAIVVDGAMSAGRHEVTIPARTLAPGTYVVRVVTGDWVLARRLTVVR